MKLTINGRPYEPGPVAEITYEMIADQVRGRGVSLDGYRVTFFTRREGAEQRAGSVFPGWPIPLEPGLVFTVIANGVVVEVAEVEK